MRKLFVVLAVMTMFVLTACVSQSDFDKEAERVNKLKTDYNELETKNKELQADYDKLFSETADWRKLSDEERTTQIANAETERVKTEIEVKKSQEEKTRQEPADKNPVEISNHHGAPGKSISTGSRTVNYYDVSGTVKNIGDRSLSYVGLKISIKDAAGTVIGSTLAWPASGSPWLMPGESRTWDRSIETDKNVASYSVEIDTFRYAD